MDDGNMLTVACVLKSGGDYGPEYVERLRDGVAANLSIPYKFVCLTDLDLDLCETIQLINDLPGWWSKIELFRLRGPVLYFDLDTVIGGNLDKIAAYPHEFTMLREFKPKGWAPGAYGSGVMAWCGDYEFILDNFTDSTPARYNTANKWGDQAYIFDQKKTVDLFQEIFPAKFASYKWTPPDQKQQAAVVCYHGQPRPQQTGWAI
jgi:hypothetical protein